jgi:hypothetical protein
VGNQDLDALAAGALRTHEPLPPGANFRHRRPAALALDLSTCCHAEDRKSPKVTDDGPDLGKMGTSFLPPLGSSASSSSELSSANTQNLESHTGRLSGSGEHGDEGVLAAAGAPNFDAPASLESGREGKRFPSYLPIA